MARKPRRRGTSALVMCAAAGIGAAVMLTSGRATPPALTTAKASPPEAAPARTTFGDAEIRARLPFAARRVVDDRVEVPLDDGTRAVLTLDPELQKTAEALLAEADAPVAAIVVMTVDGRILALAGGNEEDPKATVLDVAWKPWAPSASIFKIVTAAALVDAGVAPDATVCYHGGVRSVEASNLKDDERLDGACHSLSFGLARSQNAIFAKLVHRHLDKKTLAKYAGLFGYDGKLGTAELPDDELEFARAAAGFWHSELSPMGGALVANTIASGGRAVTPRLVAAIVGTDGEERPILPAAPVRVLEEKTAAAVAEMLVGTTETGTARKGFLDAAGRRYLGDVRVAGKTGSLSRKKPSFLDYSWFVGFAPADSPEVVVSVLLGNEPSYRFKAHTVARLVLEKALRPAED